MRDNVWCRHAMPECLRARPLQPALASETWADTLGDVLSDLDRLIGKKNLNSASTDLTEFSGHVDGTHDRPGRGLNPLPENSELAVE